MRKHLIITFALCTSISFLISACASASSESYSSEASSSAAYQESGEGYYEEMATADAAAPGMAATEMAAPMDNGDSKQDSLSDLPALDNRKIIRHSDMRLESTDFDNALNQVLNTISEKGGYVESQQTNGRSILYDGEYYERYAEISARIPVDKLDEVAEKLGTLCNITSKSERMDDITDTYFDSQARLDTLNIQEERLLEILKKAEKLEDVITLEQALSEVRYQIESLTAQLKRMDSQVSYSYLNLELHEVSEYQKTQVLPRTFGDKLSAAFVRSGDHFINAFQGILLVTVEGLPLFLLWGVLIVLIVLIARAILKAVNKRRALKSAAIKKGPSAPVITLGSMDNDDHPTKPE